MINTLEFTGKNVLITGAAIGIGKETAILLSKLGACIVLLDKDGDGLRETISCLKGDGHHSYSFDLSDLQGIEAKMREIVSTVGPLDGFVHCVGVRCRRPVSMITPEVLSQVLSLNFGSFIEIIRCITRKDYFNIGLSIVGISSISSQKGGTGVTAYAASKAAMDCSVRCLAKELTTKKIRLNTVVPAQINTPAFKDLIRMKGDTEDQTLARQYLGLGEPIDVAYAVAFLLSNSSRLITGSAIPVDGGYLSS